MAVVNQSLIAAASTCSRDCGQSPSLVDFYTSKWGRRPAQYKTVLAGRGRFAVHAIEATAHAASCAPAPLSGSAYTVVVPVVGFRQLRLPSAEELERVQLPALACSFPSMLHPQYEKVRAHCDEWIKIVAELPSSSAGCRFLQECQLPRLVCRFIPRAVPRRRLLQAIKFIAWLMIDADDDDPELPGTDLYASTCHRAESIMTILTQPIDAFHDHRLWNFDLLDGRLSRRCSRRLAALADLWREMCPEMSPLLRSRFTSSMADSLEGIKMQAVLRNEVHVPNMESYMTIRRQASFAIPAFIMAEYASGIELDQEALENANVVELRNKAVDYISLCNEIFSCYKEINLGDYFNLPSILYNTCDISIATSTRTCTSFQDAIDHMVHLAQDLDASCTSLIASLKEEYSKPSIDPLKAYHIHAYADVMTLGMSGTLAWFFEIPRYPQPCTLDHLN